VLRFLLVLALPPLFIALAPAAPVPKHLMKEPPVYFCLRKGVLEYKWDIGEVGAAFPYTQHVKEIEELKDGSKIVTVEARQAVHKYNVSSRGIVEFEQNGTTFKSPLVLLQLPARAGDSWTNTYTIGPTKFKEVRTFRGSERVEVPAGTFDALRVDVTETSGGLTTFRTIWYAPHVGVVRSEYSGNPHILRSFTPAKE
jgi:hypothetical protein